MPLTMKNSHIEDKAYEAIEYIRAQGLLAPTTIVFGSHKLRELGELALPHAHRGKALVIFGANSARKSGLTDRVDALLSRYTIKMVPWFGVVREPTVRIVDEAAALARREKVDLIIGIGGGSVIDCAKAVAALAVNEGSAADYLEGIGRGLKITNQPLPMFAIPTTAATGAEMTKNAVICVPEKGYKKSMRDPKLVPTVALVDPELCLNLPAHVTANGGMDALTHLLESCITTRRRPEVTELAHRALRNVQLGLSVAFEDPGNILARERTALVSMLGGVCLANSGLAMAHGIAAALGALHDVPHGLACGILLPHTLRYNASACSDELAGALAAFLNQVEPRDNSISDGIEAVDNLRRWLQIPPDLKYLRLSADDIRTIAEHSMGSSMSGNPIPMDVPRTIEFLETLV